MAFVLGFKDQGGRPFDWVLAMRNRFGCACLFHPIPVSLLLVGRGPEGLLANATVQLGHRLAEAKYFAIPPNHVAGLPAARLCVQPQHHT